MVKGLFHILLFYFLGEMLSLALGGLLPGSVLGMVLLFLALYFKIVKPINVKDAATIITKNMAVFFIPAAVGIMVYVELFSKSLMIIASAIVVSTVLTLITVALVQENFEKRRNKKINSNNNEQQA